MLYTTSVTLSTLKSQALSSEGPGNFSKYRLTHPAFSLYIYIKIFIAHIVYTVCTRINYKIVPVTNLNKYLH